MNNETINQCRLPATGEKVTIQGLVSASHLNGLKGKVLNYMKETHRYGIRIIDPKSAKAKSISVQAKNIQLHEDSSKSEWDSRLVHVLLPCHISGGIERNRRFEQFFQCARSLLVQAGRCRILVGVSADNEEMREKIVEVLRRFSTPPQQHQQWFVVVSNTKRSQFQHFQALLPLSKALNPSAWLMFLDNDDMYHPYRIRFFQDVIAKKYSDNMNVDGFFSGGKLLIDDKKVREKFGDEKVPELKLFLELDESLDGIVDVAADADENSEKDVIEYFDFCVRTRVLARFLSLTPDAILSHRYCDVRFAECLSRLKIMTAHHPQQEWLLMHYRIRHWDRCQFFLQRDISSRSNAMMAVDVIEADHALSRETGLDVELIVLCRKDVEEGAIQMVERDDEGLEHRRLMLVPRLDAEYGHELGSRLWKEVCSDLSSCFSPEMSKKNRQWCSSGKHRQYDLEADTNVDSNF